MNRGSILLTFIASSAIGGIVASKREAANMAKTAYTIFDFQNMENVNDWVEQSDVVRSVGMSKADLTLQKTQLFQRAVFFALLNPQPNGAGFAGMRKKDFFVDLSNFSEIQVKCRAQGKHNGFKIVLRHKFLNDEPNVTYEQMFTGPLDFETVSLPLNDFKAYYRGREIDTAEPLDTSKITGFGFQFYGGVYLPQKQSGPATLEIDWVRAM